MWAATLIPRTPLQVWEILVWSVDKKWGFPLPEVVSIDSVAPHVGSNFNKILGFIRKHNSHYPQYEWTNKSSPYDKTLYYWDELNRIFSEIIEPKRAEITREFEWSIEEALWDSKLLRAIKWGKLSLYDNIINSDFDEEEDPIEDGTLNSPEDILNHLFSSISWELKWIDNGKIDRLLIYLTKNKDGRISFEAETYLKWAYPYEWLFVESLSHLELDDLWMSLDEFKDWFERDFEWFADEIWKRYPTTREKIEKRNKLEEEKQKIRWTFISWLKSTTSLTPVETYAWSTRRKFYETISKEI